MKTINNLREKLFETMEKLESGQIDVAKAKTINEVAQTIINTAKIEHDYLKLIQDNNKHSEKKISIESVFMGKEPIEFTLKQIEENKKKPYKFDGED